MSLFSLAVFEVENIFCLIFILYLLLQQLSIYLLQFNYWVVPKLTNHTLNYYIAEFKTFSTNHFFNQITHKGQIGINKKPFIYIGFTQWLIYYYN